MLEAVTSYGSKEIGGVLIGMKKLDSSFEVVDFSISLDKKSISDSSFIRDPRISKRLIDKHYKAKSGHYIGEWHSHPKFALIPSPQDALTMCSIIHDPDYGIKFAFLLIVKEANKKLANRSFFFHQDSREIIVLDNDDYVHNLESN